jgi:serine/threonine protein kinase/Flp pilus assembly protein TadD
MSASHVHSSAEKLPSSPPQRDEALELVGRLAEEMNRRWRAGERPLAEEFLASRPDLFDNPEAVLELVAEELYLRQQFGESLDEAAIAARFPRWPRQLRALLECHRVLAPGLAGLQFPEAGQQLGDFQLIAELGRGARGRVFLARQPALSDRPVVVKVSIGGGSEHLSLARLQHTHIVPLYSVHEFPARGLSVLCLPYFGGATLAELLQRLGGVPPARRSGRDLVTALRAACGTSAAPMSAAGPACAFYERASYVQAVCWLGVRLADALAYAEERGLVHLDLKPSNVLLAVDGQPMLLDFHLARAPLAAGTPAPAWLGGTPCYMAPEQRAALAVVREGGRIVTAVDGRADVYSLGVLLYEALGGDVPLADADLAEQLSRRNPQVSPGLGAILAKCTALDPSRRYAGTAAVAEELRRYLDDLPLRGVKERSLGERWRKWRRRRPLALPAVALLIAALASAGLSLERANTQIGRARAALQTGEERLRRRQFAEAAEVFRRGQALVESLPFSGDWSVRLRDGMRQAERGLAAGELHDWCEQIRPVYGTDTLRQAEASKLLAHCRTFWGQRRLIAERLAEQPGNGLEDQIRADLLDVAIVLADLSVRHAAPSEMEAARREAVGVLDDAERLFGPSCVLAAERRARTHSQSVDDPYLVEPEPRNAQEHFALGRFYFRAGQVEQAEKEMNLALEVDPGTLWPNFWKGNCAFRSKRFDDAVVAFSVCVALAPDRAWCYSNRGLAYAEMGRLDRARDDFEHAIRLDPTDAAAFRGRGLLHCRARRYPQALADLRHTLSLGADPTAAYADLALVHWAAGNRADAVACARRSVQADPGQTRARELLDRLDGRPAAPLAGRASDDRR